MRFVRSLNRTADLQREPRLPICSADLQHSCTALNYSIAL